MSTSRLTFVVALLVTSSAFGNLTDQERSQCQAATHASGHLAAKANGHVYRGGAATPNNLTPASKDFPTGLSTFDTFEASLGNNKKAQVIDVARLHGLVAVSDGGIDYGDGHGAMPHGHVSIRPAAHLSIEACAAIKAWAATKGGPDPHHFTEKVLAARTVEQAKK